MKSRFSRRSEELKARRNRRRRQEGARVSPEQLEKRQMMAVTTFVEPVLNGGWLTVAAEDGDNIFVKQVVRSNAEGESRMDLWVADNSSFEGYKQNEIRSIATPGEPGGPYVPSIKTIQFLQGTQRKDSNLEVSGYPMWQSETTRFTLPLDGLSTRGRELTGSVSIRQPDGGTTTWVFTNRVEGGAAGGSPRLVSGPGVSEPVVPGFVYPVEMSVGEGQRETSKSVIDVRWNVQQLAQVPQLSVDVWSTFNAFAVAGDSTPQIFTLQPMTGALVPSAATRSFISLADSAGANLNPIASSTFRGTLQVDGQRFSVVTGGPSGDETLFFRGPGGWSTTATWELVDATYTVTGRLRTGEDGPRGVELSMSGDFTVSLEEATYVTMTNGAPVAATIFAGHDIQAALDVKFPASGSTFNVDSTVRVRSGGVDVSATNVNVSAELQAFDANVPDAKGGINIKPVSETPYGSVSRATEQAFGVAEIVKGGVERISIPSGLGGAGYDVASPPLVTISAPQSAGGRAGLRSIANGEVDSITVANGGGGYTTAPVVRISAPSAAGGRQAQAVAVVQGGTVIAVQVTDRGLGYNRPPVVSFEGGSGALIGGAGPLIVSAQATADVVGGLGTVAVLDGGSGYAPNSVVAVQVNNLDGRTGTGATVRALTNGRGVVETIEVLAAGTGYSLESVELAVAAPPPNLNPDVAIARAVVDPRTSRISDVVIVHKGSGYGLSPVVSIAAPATAIGEIRPLSIPELITFNAFVAADSFDIQLGDDPGTADIVRSRLLVSPSSSLARTLGGGDFATSVFVDSHDGDIFVAGQIKARTQSYRLISSQAVQDKSPFTFSTAGHAEGSQTGQVIGDAVGVTLANDLDTASRGAFAQNDVSLRTNVDSLRIRAARRSGQPIDEPFPYRLSIDEVEDIRFDAVAASSFPIVIKGNGAVQLTSSVQTVGGIDITARGDFSTTAPLATSRGGVTVTSRSMSVTNTIAVTAAARDLTGGSADIKLTATGGNLILEGDVSAVNDIRLVQQNPDDLRITDFAEAAGRALVTTAMRHGLVEGDFVSIAGTLNYDGFHKVASVSSDTTFEIDRLFIPETGRGTASRAVTVQIAGFAQSAGNTMVRTTIPHGLQVGSPVILRESETYSSSYTVLVVRSSTEFEIPRLFVAGTGNEAGTVLLPRKGSLAGAGRLSGVRLSAEAAGSIALKTNVRSIDLRSQRSVAIDELDDVRITSLVANGRAAVFAAGADPLETGYNSIALTVDQATGISQLEVSAPNGSLDITVSASTPVAMGGAEFKAMPNMQSAGNVRIRSQASSLNVYDAPVAGGSARSVRAATTAPVLAAYLPGVESIKAGELRGNGNINATGVFDGVNTLAAGDRVLVRRGSSNAGATTADSNGVYVVSQVGGGAGTAAQWRLTRALDSATAALMPSNSVVRVGEGATLANTAHRVRYASIPSDAALFVATDKFQLPLDYPAFGLLQSGQLVQGEEFSGTVDTVDSSTGLVTLNSVIIPATVVGAAGTVVFPTAALGFGEIVIEEIELTTNIGTDPFSTTSFIVSSTGGTNGDAGSLGKMLLLRQANDTSAEPLNPIQRMAFGFGNLAGPIRLTQELPLVVTPIAIDGSSRFAVPAAVGVPFAPVVVDGSRIVTNREGSPVRVVRGTPEIVNGFEFTDGSAAVGLAAGASLTNVTIGGFAAGAAIKIDGVNGILLNALSVGRSESGDRLANKIGIQVTGPGANASVVSSTVVASNQVGIQVEADAAGITVVGTSVGTVGQGNAYGLDLKGGYNQIGVVPVPTGIRKSQAVFNGTTLPIPAKILSVVPSPLFLGQPVGGTGIAPGTTIAAINGGTLTLSKPMTMTRATNLVFGQPKRNSVQGNLFGAAISGGINVVRNTDFGNNTYDGINVTGGTNFIGTSPKRDATSNAFFGNGRWGVHLSAAAKATAQILGNFFGSVARATAGQANGSGSVAIEGQPAPDHTPAFAGIRKVTTDRFGNQHVMPILRRGLAGTKSSTVVPPKQSWR